MGSIKFFLPTEKSLRNRQRTLTIRKKLKKDFYKILSPKPSLSFIYEKYWDLLSKKYKSYKKNPGYLKINNWKSSPSIKESLKNKFLEIINIKLNEKNIHIYKSASKWCVIPHTLKSRAIELGYTFLGLKDTDQNENEIWEIRIKEYKPGENEINYLETLDISNENIQLSERIKSLKLSALSLLNIMNCDEEVEIAWNTLLNLFVKKTPIRKISSYFELEI